MKITEEVVEVPPLANSPEAAEKTAVNAAPQQKSTTLSLQCEQCDYKSTSEKGLKQHARMKHRVSELAADEDDNPVLKAVSTGRFKKIARPEIYVNLSNFRGVPQF